MDPFALLAQPNGPQLVMTPPPAEERTNKCRNLQQISRQPNFFVAFFYNFFLNMCDFGLCRQVGLFSFATPTAGSWLDPPTPPAPPSGVSPPRPAVWPAWRPSPLAVAGQTPALPCCWPPAWTWRPWGTGPRRTWYGGWSSPSAFPAGTAHLFPGGPTLLAWGCCSPLCGFVRLHLLQRLQRARNNGQESAMSTKTFPVFQWPWS